MPSVKQCSKCGAPFGCNNDGGGCWCEDHTLTLDTLKELKATFDNCLCPQCLRTYAIDTSSGDLEGEVERL